MKKALLNIINFALADVAGWFGTLWSWTMAGGALLGGVLLALIQKYLIRDLAFIPWLLLVVTLDTIAGYLLAKKRYKADPLHWPQPTGQSLREKLTGKLTAITVSLVLLNVLTNFEISGIPAQNAFIDLKVLGYEFDLNIFKAIYFSGATYMILTEAKSTIRNVRGLGYNLFSSKIDDALDKFTGEEKEKTNGI